MKSGTYGTEYLGFVPLYITNFHCSLFSSYVIICGLVCLFRILSCTTVCGRRIGLKFTQSADCLAGKNHRLVEYREKNQIYFDTGLFQVFE